VHCITSNTRITTTTSHAAPSHKHHQQHIVIEPIGVSRHRRTPATLKRLDGCGTLCDAAPRTCFGLADFSGLAPWPKERSKLPLATEGPDYRLALTEHGI
jgi:hypothetical protein